MPLKSLQIRGAGVRMYAQPLSPPLFATLLGIYEIRLRYANDPLFACITKYEVLMPHVPVYVALLRLHTVVRCAEYITVIKRSVYITMFVY